MGPKAQQARERIVEAADALLYTQGFENTSFADITDAVQISRGNFYYHFKTKDDILDAVIDKRLAKTGDMLQSWETQGNTPVEHIRCFIHMMSDNQSNIQRYGCPVGTLCTELAKLNHASKQEANKLFALFRHCLSGQFRLLGKDEAQAEALAMHLLARSQGIATLSSAFQDKAFIQQEVKQLDDWLAEKIQHT
jgi:AcrR family transcriptional regulator